MEEILKSEAFHTLLYGVIGSVLGWFAHVATPIINRKIERYQPHAQIGARVLQLMDAGLVGGSDRLQGPWFDAAKQYVYEVAEGPLTEAEVESAARWAVENFSAKVHDRRLRSGAPVYAGEQISGIRNL
ncbi:MAG: hypothetical protein AAFN18_12015 [Cyanobacteria bacterium J06554_6]